MHKEKCLLLVSRTSDSSFTVELIVYWFHNAYFKYYSSYRTISFCPRIKSSGRLAWMSEAVRKASRNTVSMLGRTCIRKTPLNIGIRLSPSVVFFQPTSNTDSTSFVFTLY